MVVARDTLRKGLIRYPRLKATRGLIRLLLGASMLVATAARAGTIDWIDTNHDGQISLDEAKAAGLKTFDQLDGSHKGALDEKEAESILDDSDFKKADTDVDGTIDKKEYINHLQDVFEKADTDENFKLDATEQKNAAGAKLIKLIGGEK